MARQIRRRWQPRYEGLSRQDRRGCEYAAYLPDPIVGWNPELPADVVADLTDAESAIRRLNDAGTAHVSLEGLARFLLRAESVASSRVEGLGASPRRLVRAEALIAESGDIRDRAAVEVLGNIAAMQSAVRLAAEESRFGLDELLSVHRVLMGDSDSAERAGVVRDEQNWIGGSSYNPCRASFVPPPPEHVDGLLRDLMEYLNGDEHPPLLQAALAHAQFETIHPFVDGNGRTGRALVHVILRRRGLAEAFVPPISLVLANWAPDYVSGLMAFRHLSGPRSSERSRAAADWARIFAAAAQRSCADAERYANRIDALAERWRARLGRVRRGSAADLLLEVLPGVPVLTVASAAALIGRSTGRTADAISSLAEAGILTQRNLGKQRYRVFEAVDVLDLFTGLERALARPPR